MPRPNGYQSLHTSVISDRGLPFEVQIRTEDMHRIAEEGIAAHWKYKEGRVGASRDEQYFRWLRQLLEWQQEVRDPHEFIQHLKIDLYPEEVYCFTPRGEVKALPRGATPIDFAYAIHTDVGHHCVGARVNGTMVPLRTHAEERRHRRDHDAARAQAEPRLARLRHARHGRAARSGTTSTARRRRARSSSASKLFDKEARRFDVSSKVLTDEALLKAAHEHGLQQGRRPASPPSATARSRRARCCRSSSPSTSCSEKPPETGLAVDGQARAAARARTASRSRASTICWSSAPAAATRSAARRSSATSPAARACRCTRRRARNVVNLMYDPERRIEVEWDSAGQDDGAVHRAAGGAGRGQEGDAGRGQRQGRRHEHQHPHDGGDDRATPAAAST